MASGAPSGDAHHGTGGPEVDLEHSLCGNLCAPITTCRMFLAEFQRGTNSLRMCSAVEANAYWPFIFGTSPWFDEMSIWLLLVRGTLALVFIGHAIAAASKSWKGGRWFMFLTNWSLCIEVVYLCMATFTAWAARAEIRRCTEGAKMQAVRLPPFVLATWALNHVAMPAVLLVAVMYWTLVNPVWAVKRQPDYIGFFVHGINLVLLLVDLFVGRNVFYLKHAIWFFIFVCMYLVWTLIHFAARIGQANPCKSSPNDPRDCPIYTVLNWHKPMATGILAFIIVLCVVPLCQYPLWWCGYKRRITDEYLRSRTQPTVVGVQECDAQT